MYCKRVSDGIDWYDYARNTKNFATKSIKITILRLGQTWVTQAVSDDAQRLFPQTTTLIEVIGYTGTDPIADFASKTYDEASGLFSSIERPPNPIIVTKADIWRRASDEEVEIILAGLGQQSLRKQRLFYDAQYLDLDDSDFADLKAGFVAAFGQARADELLAPSSSAVVMSTGPAQG